MKIKHAKELQEKLEKELNLMVIQTHQSVNEIKNTFNLDIELMQKTVRNIRKSKRHIRQKHIMELQKEELEFEDFISSSDEFAEENHLDKYNLPKSIIEDFPITKMPEEEWISDYESDSFQNSPSFLKYAYNHEAYKQAKDSMERNVLFLLLLVYDAIDSRTVAF